jgi:dihydroorotate dehydrogenase
MLVESTGKHTPICVKIAPDMTEQETRDVTRAILVAGMDGIIATNTTLDRSAVQGLPHADESGGLSGRPLCARSLEVLRIVRDEAGSDFPIIGVGGIMTGGDAAQRFKAGADLVQIYTGLIYRGDGLIREIVDAWPGRPHVD